MASVAHGVNNTAEHPDVYLVTDRPSFVLVDHLRWSVHHSRILFEFFEGFISNDLVAFESGPEVAEFKLFVLKQHILQFQISMRHFHFLQVQQSFSNLGGYENNLWL